MGEKRAIALCPAQLPAQIEAITNRPEFERSRWGIVVEPLQPSGTSPAPLYATAADQYFVPASNVKLLTTAAALVQLGPNFQTYTTAYLSPLKQIELRISSQGDPSLTTERLQVLAEQMRDRNIPFVNRLVIDDTYFRGDPINATWEWEDVQSGYGAPVNSLMLNQNEIVVHLYPQQVGQPLRLEWRNPPDSDGWQVINRSLTVPSTEAEWIRVGRDFSDPILYIDGQLHAGSRRDVSAVAISDPTAYFAQQFQDVLLQAGITVDEVFVAGPLDDVRDVLFARESSGDAIATLPSLSMTEWLRSANQDSDNLAAESLLRQLGTSFATADMAENPDVSTLATAINQLELTLAGLGITADSYRVADGSGLSRRNLVTPMAFVQVLQAMAAHPWSEIYRDSLAIAATTGTLRYRFQDTVIAGNLYGKSGGLTGVASLSGYLYPPNYSPLAFSIILNHSPQSGRVNRQAIDEIVLQLTQLRDCL